MPSVCITEDNPNRKRGFGCRDVQVDGGDFGRPSRQRDQHHPCERHSNSRSVGPGTYVAQQEEGERPGQRCEAPLYACSSSQHGECSDAYTERKHRFPWTRERQTGQGLTYDAPASSIDVMQVDCSRKQCGSEGEDRHSQEPESQIRSD